MNSKEIAQAVKNYLVDLAINDKLPMDMNDISIKGLEKVIKEALPTSKDEMVNKASNYLSDGDLSTEEMVDAIMGHMNGDDLIDNVDGVVVWEKVVNTFTCDEFISLIQE